ncbi:hypothetical protein L211DRAFT_841297 [Terfezia boudieri ATCC MYA-4762]|uniref:Uncharacterized protein n=1 Tax=Terfezia boudieri ATCC MYA-4762 TaxID=1051890 RepID=A0A3N4LDL4_9PEZI|nr:hypothetical protein L211DRAFT_841297 [Terfezia boudieri ATCC MYA-4762]
MSRPLRRTKGNLLKKQKTTKKEMMMKTPLSIHLLGHPHQSVPGGAPSEPPSN